LAHVRKWIRSSRRSPAAKLYLALGLLLLHGTAFAQADAVPMKVQALFIKKVAAFDRALSNKPLKVAIIHQKDSSESVADVLSAFGAVGVSAIGVIATDFKTDGMDFTVAFILNGATTPAVIAEAEKAQLLTISSTVPPVTEGKVTMAFGVREDGKPQIIVHLARSKTQGRLLSSDLLNLARVIR
jgi:hypothetical protein